MLFSNIENELLSLDDAGGVVIADPKDEAYPIAIRYALSTGRALRIWLFDSTPPKLSFEGRSVVLVASWSRISSESIRLLYYSLHKCGKRQRDVGLITGLSLEMIEQVVGRSTKLALADLPSGWILADEKVLSNVICGARKLVAENFTTSTIFEEIRPLADYGIIVGHGREDICYFNSFAVCGQSIHKQNSRPCNADSCSYDIPKIYADMLTAQILIFLSCSSGKLGDGLFPPTCRLALSSMFGGTIACLAVQSLFTLTSSLVNYVLLLLENGCSIGKIARLAGEWHYELTGELEPFIVFGEPDICSLGIGEHLAEVPILTSWNSADSSNLELIKGISFKLAKISNGLETLKALNLLPESGQYLRSFLDSKEKTISQLITFARTNDRARDNLKKLFLHIEEIAQDTELSLINSLTEQSLNNYFWLAGSYSHFKLTNRQEIHCFYCNSHAVREIFQHPFLLSILRYRTTCSRCGITQDLSNTSEQVSIVSGYIWREEDSYFGSVGLNVESADSSGLLNLTINKGRRNLNRVELLASSNPEGYTSLPIRIKSPIREQIRLHLSGIMHGVYFVKAFWIADLQLSIASAPITFLNSDCSEKVV